MIAIIQYDAGNIKSVENAIVRLGYECCITNDTDKIRKADKVIFPGVGEASTAMKYLNEKDLVKLIPTLQQPVLGICLGLQLMCISSEEGNIQGFGIFNTVVKKFPPKEFVPHTGWNNSVQIEGKLFEGIQLKDDFVYMHSYYAEVCEQTNAICDYIFPFSAALQRDNFFAVQFHPEKSGLSGEKLLINFLKL